MGYWTLYLEMIFKFFFAWFTCWSFSGLTRQLVSSEIVLGRLLFQKYLLEISMAPCVNFLARLVFWKVLDFAVHELNLVRQK